MRYLRKLKIQLVKGEYKNPIKGQVRDPKQAYEVIKAIKDKAQETVIGVYLSDKLEVNAYDVLSLGGVNSTYLATNEIFDRAVVSWSWTFILIHNHPSGNPHPSPQDREVMEVLKEQSKVMRRNFLDFIIVGEGKYWSMFEEEDGGEYLLGATY
jgi:DNA repair protein RadC